MRGQIIEALRAEDAAAQAAMAANVDTSGWTAELREFRDLGQRTSIAGYMQATVSEKRVDGAEAEYNDHVFGANWQQGDYPLEMLLDRGEYFALSAQAIGDMQDEEKRTLITGVVSGRKTKPTLPASWLAATARIWGRRTLRSALAVTAIRLCPAAL